MAKYTYQDPEFWGGNTWDYLFKTSFGSPDFWTLRDKTNYRAWLASIVSVLPCAECKKNAELYIKKNPIEFKNKKQLLDYLVGLRVNADYHAGKKKRFDLKIWIERNGPK